MLKVVFGVGLGQKEAVCTGFLNWPELAATIVDAWLNLATLSLRVSVNQTLLESL